MDARGMAALVLSLGANLEPPSADFSLTVSTRAELLIASRAALSLLVAR